MLCLGVAQLSVEPKTIDVSPPSVVRLGVLVAQRYDNFFAEKSKKYRGFTTE